MQLPFSVDQFMDVFQRYNLSIWPMQVIAYLLGVTAIVLASKPMRYSDRIVSGVLAFFWIWMGVVYHLLNFSQINRAAIGFGVMFVLQGALFLVVGVVKPRLSFRASSQPIALVGGALVIYAMIVYSVIGMSVGHSYPQSPVFGVAPCPTTIFTFGLLLLSSRKVPKYFLAVPLIWSVIGFGAAISLGIYEDTGLLIAGVLSTALLLRRDRGAVRHPDPRFA
jgi:hypothetical protein